MRKKLTSIQWRFAGYVIWICLFVALVLVTMIFFYYRLDFRTLISLTWFHLPFVLLLLIFVGFVGTFSGYFYGNMLKKRLETLVESILKFERGNYAHRVPELGEDEVGVMADHLNEMVSRVEAQVASLQKLSTEKTEWDEQLKRTAVSEERQRLARELHDAVSQQLFAISMMTSAIQEDADSVDDKVRERIAAVEQMAGNAQNEMRALLLHLRPATLEGKGLKEGLAELIDEFQAKQPIKIQWEAEDIPELAKGVEDHLFRIVQEAMSNVFRHSQATSVTVKLGVAGSQIFLRVIDNGVGFDMANSKPSSYGLQSIQERANEIGGVADMISFPDKGTQIEIKVPIIDQK